MDLEKPYYKINKEWYYFDENEGRDVLTDKAPKKAIESYKEFYKMIETGGLEISDEDLLKMKKELNK